MTDGYYDYKMDLWGVGCVMFEITSLYPLFPGNNELDQVHRIHSILGTPNPKILDRFRKHATHMEINFQQKVLISSYHRRDQDWINYYHMLLKILWIL